MASWTIVLSLVIASTAVGAPLAPMRPLPVGAQRKLPATPSYYVDAAKGDDKQDGSQAKPWKTIAAAAKRLKPGDTLVLRGGTYFESVTLALQGTADKPITIRGMTGEVAIVDAGIREFEDAPKTAWEPLANGEYRSKQAFPQIAKEADKGRGVWVLGNFADSMVPLHGYRFAEDLRATNQIWNVPGNVTPGEGIYLGPGVWLDWTTHKIHARLAPTSIDQPASYTGESDPRKLALVIGVDRSALTLDRAAHLRIQDIVFRGSATRTVAIAGSEHVELDGVTIYGGAPALWISATHHFTLTRSALRGISAPWSSRASLKYRGISPYLLVADSRSEQSHDWEISYSDFTDGHDGLVLDSLKTLRFHHNRIDNFNDDALYLTLPPRAHVPEDLQIFENLITRTYTALSFAADETPGAAPNAIGPGAYVYRNVFDLRGPTYGWIAKAPGGKATMLASRICADHGTPVWEPLFFYQNTVINAGPAYRDYYGLQLAMGTKNTRRRLFNNIFVQVEGNPGLVLAGQDDDFQADGNLLWGLRSSPRDDFFARRKAPAGFGAHDVFTDPRLTSFDGPLDVRPTQGGAVDAGVKLPPAWPDSLRSLDAGAPDIGALPRGAPMLQVGPQARPAR